MKTSNGTLSVKITKTVGEAMKIHKTSIAYTPNGIGMIIVETPSKDMAAYIGSTLLRRSKDGCTVKRYQMVGKKIYPDKTFAKNKAKAVYGVYRGHAVI